MDVCVKGNIQGKLVNTWSTGGTEQLQTGHFQPELQELVHTQVAADALRCYGDATATIWSCLVHC